MIATLLMPIFFSDPAGRILQALSQGVEPGTSERYILRATRCRCNFGYDISVLYLRGRLTVFSLNGHQRHRLSSLIYLYKISERDSEGFDNCQSDTQRICYIHIGIDHPSRHEHYSVARFSLLLQLRKARNYTD